MLYNALACTLPSEFGMIRELVHLYMQSTAILGTSLSELGQLQSRQQLFVRFVWLCASGLLGGGRRHAQLAVTVGFA